MRSFALVGSLLLCGCANNVVNDSGVPEPGAAYVALYPVVMLGRTTLDRFDLTVVCVDSSRKRHTFLLPKSAPREPIVFKAPEGACFVSHIALPPYTYQAHPPLQETLFETKVGQINFPGAWTIHFRGSGGGVSASSSGDLSFSQDVLVSVAVENIAAARTTIRRQFPNLSDKLPLEYTRVEHIKVEPSLGGK